MSVASKVETEQSLGKCWDALFGVAVTVYFLVELVKLALHQVGAFFKALFYRCRDDLQIAWQENWRLLAALPELLEQVAWIGELLVRPLIGALYQLFRQGRWECVRAATGFAHASCELMTWGASRIGYLAKEGMACFEEGGREALRVGAALPALVAHYTQPVRELVRALVRQLIELLRSGGREVCALVKTSGEALCTLSYELWECCRAGVESLLDAAWLLLREGNKLTLTLVEGLDEATYDLRLLVKNVLIQLFSYLVSGYHELDRLICAGLPQLAELLKMGTETLLAACVELAHSFVVGVQEMGKVAQGVASFIDESTSGARHFLACLMKQLITQSKMTGLEIARVTQASLEGIYLLGSSTAEWVVLIWQRLLDYLLSSAKEAVHFLSASVYLAEAGVEIAGHHIEAVAKTVYEELKGAGHEVAAFCQAAAKAIYVEGENLLDYIRTLCKALFSYLQSGGTTFLQLVSYFTQGVDESFHVLILWPLQDWWEPKYQWIQKRLSALKDAVGKWCEKRKRAFHKMREAITHRLKSLQVGIQVSRERIAKVPVTQETLRPGKQGNLKPGKKKRPSYVESASSEDDIYFKDIDH